LQWCSFPRSAHGCGPPPPYTPIDTNGRPNTTRIATSCPELRSASDMNGLSARPYPPIASRESIRRSIGTPPRFGQGTPWRGAGPTLERLCCPRIRPVEWPLMRGHRPVLKNASTNPRSGVRSPPDPPRVAESRGLPKTRSAPEGPDRSPPLAEGPQSPRRPRWWPCNSGVRAALPRLPAHFCPSTQPPSPIDPPCGVKERCSKMGPGNISGTEWFAP